MLRSLAGLLGRLKELGSRPHLRRVRRRELEQFASEAWGSDNQPDLLFVRQVETFAGVVLEGMPPIAPGLRRVQLACADLEQADLRSAYLCEANLQEANLRHASLRWANLRRANLRRAQLENADLSNTCLRDADLYEANLFSAVLTGADLRGADLRCANLLQASFSEANFRGADLRGAALLAGYRNLLPPDADLRGVRYVVLPEEGWLHSWGRPHDPAWRRRIQAVDFLVVPEDYDEQAAVWRILLQIDTHPRSSVALELRGDVEVGRGATVDMSLLPRQARELEGVSRRHALLSPGPASLTLTDLESTNGTFVNGECLESGQPHELHHGDEIMLGILRLVLVIVQRPGDG